jgi:hypothetical protein
MNSTTMLAREEIHPMIRSAIQTMILILLAASPARAQTPPSITPLPQDLEIELALSALPVHLRAEATVYSLNRHTGFEVARRGRNGFHTFVARQDDSLYRGQWPLRTYRNDVLIPIAFDAEGAETIMRVHFDIARLQAMGTPPEELKHTMQGRYAEGYYRAPKRAGVSYMLAPVMRAYLNPDEGDALVTISSPHLMFYAPYVTNEHIGGLPMSHGPFVINGGPHGYMITLLGETERAAIMRESATMLDRLCRFNVVFCL